MKIDKQVKQEIDEEISTGWYATKKILIKITIAVLILSAISAVGGVAYQYWKTNADRVIFKQSITYNEGMLDDLAKYKYEYESTDDDVEKAAISRLVNSRFANFDESKIESYDLRQFLEYCRSGKY